MSLNVDRATNRNPQAFSTVRRTAAASAANPGAAERHLARHLPAVVNVPKVAFPPEGADEASGVTEGICQLHAVVLRRGAMGPVSARTRGCVARGLWLNAARAKGPETSVEGCGWPSSKRCGGRSAVLRTPPAERRQSDVAARARFENRRAASSPDGGRAVADAVRAMWPGGSERVAKRRDRAVAERRSRAERIEAPLAGVGETSSKRCGPRSPAPRPKRNSPSTEDRRPATRPSAARAAEVQRRSSLLSRPRPVTPPFELRSDLRRPKRETV